MVLLVFCGSEAERVGELRDRGGRVLGTEGACVVCISDETAMPNVRKIIDGRCDAEICVPLGPGEYRLYRGGGKLARGSVVVDCRPSTQQRES